MNIDLTTVLYLSYIIATGIAFAIIYTNIQRSAYTKFISALISDEAFSEDNAKTLKELNIKGIAKLVVKSSVKNKLGLGKSVSALYQKSGNDALEAFLSGTSNDVKYYIHDENHSAVKEKYNYKPIKTMHLIGYFLALIIAMILFTVGIKMFFDKYITPKIESDTQEKIEEQISDFEDNDSAETDAEQSEPTVPVIPTLD